MEKQAAIIPTVEGFLMYLTGALTQYDKRQMRGRFYNPNALGLYLQAKQEIEKDVSRYRKSQEPEALEALKKSIGRRFHVNDMPPAKKTIKAIDAFLATGKAPKYPGGGRRAMAERVNMNTIERVVRRFKVALSRSDAKGSPAKEALSDAWDYLDEKFYKIDTYFLGDIVVIHDELYGSAHQRLAESMSNGLKRFERQTRSWRSGFNLWLEGRDIDVPRMIRDLEKTLGALQKIRTNLSKLEKGISRDFPDVWKETKWGYDQAVKFTEQTIQLFSTAVKLLKAGKF